jgi:hypothetical protein
MFGSERFSWSESSIHPTDLGQQSRLSLQDLESTNDQQLQDFVTKVQQVCSDDLDSFLDIVEGVVQDDREIAIPMFTTKSIDARPWENKNTDSGRATTGPSAPHSVGIEPFGRDKDILNGSPHVFSIPRVEYESILSEDTMLERDYERIQEKYLPKHQVEKSIYFNDLSQSSIAYLKRNHLQENTMFLDVDRIQRLPKLS